tara:strand:+ start:181 stop:1068 length:888 start_codon:yes stop_codon:yes gene_type:complete
MANLKDLRNRIKSVQSTKKITSAMKMIAAAKLKKAQNAAESSRAYATEMGRIMTDLVSKQTASDTAPKLLSGTGSDLKHLVVVLTSNRGLCGGFNTSVTRTVKKFIRSQEAEQKDVQILMVGKKGIDLLKQDHGHRLVGEHLSITNPRFFNAEAIAADIIERFEKGDFDICTLAYNKFISALSQEPTLKQLIPFRGTLEDKKAQKEATPLDSIYEYEPSQEEVLDRLLPRNIKVQIFSALLESAASEHGSRMAAMDGATRNAEDLIGNLNLTYNRKRQAYITSELIEIISGAEAL